MSQNGDASIEALMQQLLNTFGQLWKRLKIDLEETEDDVMILGRLYPKSKLSSLAIVTDVHSRLWFTYRAGFEPIEKAEPGPGPLTFLRSMIFNTSPNNTIGGVFNTLSFLTDVGWGCMIRTSQSLLANALQTVVLGRDYKYSDDTSIQPSSGEEEGSNTESEEESRQLRDIVNLFGDNYKSPFSLHNFIQVASRLPLQVKPGEWFGPSAASLSIKRLCDSLELSTLPKLNVYISESGGLNDDDVTAEFENGAPLLILLPVRLGIQNINAIYHPSLLQLLSLKHSVGIAGGKPSSSYYFFGYQRSDLLYLDPHNLQSVSDDLGTYHTKRCLTLPISELDPSMVIGILVNDADDYAAFKASVESSNKIVQFHAHSRRRKSATAEQREEYVKIRRDPDVDALDDFVDLGDDLSDDNVVSCDITSCESETPSVDPELEFSGSNDEYVELLKLS